MGGRGAASSGGGYLSAAVVAELPYTVIDYDDPLGGATYPFLEQTRRAWRILTHPVGAVAEPHPAHTFGRDGQPRPPTLRWVNGDQVNDLYVDGMNTEEFLAATGLHLDMHKGGFVLSKRLSRIMRPHFVSGFYAPEEVRIAYMEQTAEEAKVWDGAALISRRMLRKLAAATSSAPALGTAEGTRVADGLTPAKCERLEAELRHAQRVEFTVMTPHGQDKGHAVAADDLRDANGNPVDFLLPRDTKKEVRLLPADGGAARTFVGLSMVHGHNQMRLDIQSLINLHPFFSEEQLLGWLKEEGELFVQAVETGQVAEAMGRIDRHTIKEEVQAWPLREYFASGGQPLWFRSHVKSLLNQHLQRLNYSTLEKMRLPIPGGRHYVMPTAVGQRAGIQGLDVPRGHIQIDDRRGTAWVNDADWLALPDSPKGEGIAGILGGADNDDALWLHPFTDHDGERKVLVWRSPNQVGEYLVLRPTENSQGLPWTTGRDAAGEREMTLYPEADSRKLPPRVDFTDTDYLGLVDSATAGGLGEGERYSVAVMEAAIERAIANQGSLGAYCNALMLNKALYGRLPATPPAPLEEIIDSAVKTGADLSRVVSWNYANTREILESRIPIPALLHKRLSVDWADKENRPPLPRTSGVAHWLDRLEAGIQAHIRHMEEQREALAAQARPPQAVLAAATPEEVALGAGLNQRYTAVLQASRKEKREDGLARARAAVVDYLAHFPPPQRGAVLLGALASVYGQEDTGRNDTAVWLGAEKGEKTAVPGTAVSVAHETIQALRAVGVLDELVVTTEGLVVYPAGLVADG
jgi:hypothetical protein